MGQSRPDANQNSIAVDEWGFDGAQHATASQLLRLSSMVSEDGVQMAGDTSQSLQHIRYMIILSTMELVVCSQVPLITEGRKGQAPFTPVKVAVGNQKSIPQIMKGTFNFCPDSCPQARNQ